MRKNTKGGTDQGRGETRPCREGGVWVVALALIIVCCASLRAGTSRAPFESTAVVGDTLQNLQVVRPGVIDRQSEQAPNRVHLTGWVGRRMEVNEKNRLVKIDPARLLEGYRKRPGRQSWDGEHVGKWLHAATLAWVNTGDPDLRQKLDYTVDELLKCQLSDGYLGTYLEKDRWTDWDVWAHKYNLIGLLTYVRYTGRTEPIAACRRMADLLCAAFGDDAPGKRDLIKAGHHVGMAPTSVLEPMMLLYRMTGEQRYLDFAKYILRAWEQPNGPRIVSTLLSAKRVDKVGNGKAYEMLSCLNGALEYHRTVDDPRILQASLNAWQDIVQNRLYVTGAASYGELFHDDFDLPNVANVGETCVTVTWLQFNAQLLRLTGQARFADQLEHVILNQLLGAQSCDGAGWGYYVQMEGKKPYSSTLDGHCCLSSGPRGLALIPTFAVTTDTEGVVVNLYDSGTAAVALADGRRVALSIETAYPAEKTIRVTLNSVPGKSFALKLREPSWCKEPAVTVNGRKVSASAGADGYLAIRRTWKEADHVEIRLPLAPRVIVGDHRNAGKIALGYGPLILAADEALIQDNLSKTEGRIFLRSIAVAAPDLGSLAVTPRTAPERYLTWPGAKVFRMNAVMRRAGGSLQKGSSLTADLVPFADAGSSGSEYKVWLPLTKSQTNGNALFEGQESRSRPGNLDGSILSEDPEFPVVTFDGKMAAEDWFAVSLADPVAVTRVVFVHGKTFHDGGWFDATAGKPRIEIQTEKNGAWQKVGELSAYPNATMTSAAGLRGGERFECRLASTKVWAVRVIGKPACGDNPQQAFSSCAQLQAY